MTNAQRKLSRRIVRANREHRPLSQAKNLQKQRKIVAKLAAAIMRRRKNFLHKTSTALIKNHDLVAAEELRSKNMLKNHALAMRLQDSGWRTFLGMLTYKAKLYDKIFIAVNPRNTTQTCHHCGYVLTGPQKLTLKERTWTCPICKMHHNCDVNAAKNILAKAKQQLTAR